MKIHRELEQIYNDLLFPELESLGTEEEIEEYIETLVNDLLQRGKESQYVKWLPEDYVEDFKNHMDRNSLDGNPDKGNTKLKVINLVGTTLGDFEEDKTMDELNSLEFKNFVKTQSSLLYDILMATSTSSIVKILRDDEDDWEWVINKIQPQNEEINEFKRIQKLAGVKLLKEEENFSNIVDVSSDYEDIEGFIRGLVEALKKFGLIVKSNPLFDGSDQIGVAISNKDFDVDAYANSLRDEISNSMEDNEHYLMESYQDKLENMLADYGTEGEITQYIKSLNNDPNQEEYVDFSDEDFIEDFKEFINNKYADGKLDENEVDTSEMWEEYYPPSDSYELFDGEHFYNRSGGRLRNPREYQSGGEGYTPWGDE